MTNHTSKSGKSSGIVWNLNVKCVGKLITLRLGIRARSFPMRKFAFSSSLLAQSVKSKNKKMMWGLKSERNNGYRCILGSFLALTSLWLMRLQIMAVEQQSKKKRPSSANLWPLLGEDVVVHTLHVWLTCFGLPCWGQVNTIFIINCWSIRMKGYIIGSNTFLRLSNLLAAFEYGTDSTSSGAYTGSNKPQTWHSIWSRISELWQTYFFFFFFFTQTSQWLTF